MGRERTSWVARQWKSDSKNAEEKKEEQEKEETDKQRQLVVIFCRRLILICPLHL